MKYILILSFILTGCAPQPIYKCIDGILYKRYEDDVYAVYYKGSSVWDGSGGESIACSNSDHNSITDDLTKLRKIDNQSLIIEKWDGALPKYIGTNLPFIINKE